MSASVAGTRFSPLPPERAPDEGQTVELTFERGVPVALDGEPMGLVELIDAVAELAVRSHHDHATTVPDGDLPPHLVDDRIVAGRFGVNGTQACLPSGMGAAPCLPLEDQHDLVLGQVCGRQLGMQPVSGARAVTPPAVGSTAHNVGTVDNEDLHPATV